MAVKRTLHYAVLPLILAIAGTWSAQRRLLQSQGYMAATILPSVDSGVRENDIVPYNEHELQLYMHRQRTSLLNESSVMQLGWRGGSTPMGLIADNFAEDMEVLPSWILLSETRRDLEFRNRFADPSRVGDLLVASPRLGAGVCDAMKVLAATGGFKKHVVIADIDENRGAFSEPVRNRTKDGAGFAKRLSWCGCNMNEFWSYINHENVSAIFTTTHQSIDRPNIISLPLGVKNAREVANQLKKPMDNRTELLLIAQSNWRHRAAIADRVIRNFNGTIRNRFKDGSNYYDNLRTSKFVLSPSGLGWDCYRTWEALAMGSIPVLETYYRKDGLYRTYDDLPVFWVDHYDNVSMKLLEEAYPVILSKAREYNFEKLTKRWWIDLINRYRVKS